MTHIPFVDYHRSECELKTPSGVFIFLYKSTGGFPCQRCAYDTKTVKRPQGCAAKVELMKLVRPGTAQAKKPKVFTNAEIAKKMKISKRQVAKLRKTGKLPKEYS